MTNDDNTTVMNDVVFIIYIYFILCMTYNCIKTCFNYNNRQTALLIENQVKSSPDIKLKAHQKIWLLEENQQLRENTDDWLEKLTSQMTKWLIQNYEKLLGKQAIKQGEAERLHIKKIITDCKEALR